MALWILLLLIQPLTALAIDDHFVTATKVEGQYFVISLSSGLDIEELLRQLSSRLTDTILSGRSLKEDLPDPAQQLARMMDVLFERVGDILDMPLYSFKGTLKICGTQKELESIYSHLYEGELPDTGYSFYISEVNTIYISAENFRWEILGHEMGHSVISNYFVVQPPVKVQEVLAGYVEYQLQKSER